MCPNPLKLSSKQQTNDEFQNNRQCFAWIIYRNDQIVGAVKKQWNSHELVWKPLWRIVFHPQQLVNRNEVTNFRTDWTVFWKSIKQT